MDEDEYSPVNGRWTYAMSRKQTRRSTAGHASRFMENLADVRSHWQHDSGLQTATRPILENDLAAMTLDNGLRHR